jgi:hypothetical protein
MQLDQLKRRDFITLLGGAAAAWPLGARAQQGDRMRRIGVLMNLAADDPEGQARLTAFAQGLQQLGWTDGRNVRIDYRWGAGDRRCLSQICRRAFSARARRHFGLGHPKRSSIAEGDPHRTHRIRAGRRPRWSRLGREPRAAGRKHHRFYPYGIRHRREMAGVAQRDRRCFGTLR